MRFLDGLSWLIKEYGAFLFGLFFGLAIRLSYFVQTNKGQKIKVLVSFDTGDFK
jgi:hypothetical protein